MDNKIVANGVIWNAVGKYSSQGISFLVSIVMARLLTPQDYGILGIIAVFIAISDTFIDAGFSNALIKKANCSAKDLSTVFYCNVSISILVFLILFICAPYIANFYKIPILVQTTRVMALSFIINSFGAVSRTLLVKELNFKATNIITLIGSITSGIIGILLAIANFGVWALVFQTVLTSLIITIINIIYAKWIPLFTFSKNSFHELFGFGSKLLASNVAFQIHNNLYNLVIGKAFNSTQLGYFSRAAGYAHLIPGNIYGLFQGILFPVLSKIQDNDDELLEFCYKAIKITSFIIFPCIFFLVGAAKPLIILMITDKWLPVVPLLQILCLGYLFDYLPSIWSNFYLAKGRSDFFLRMQMISKPVSLILLVITAFISMEAVAWSKVISMFVCVATSAYYIKIVLETLSYTQICKCLFTPFIISFVLMIGLLLYSEHVKTDWITLLIGTLGYWLTYFIFEYVLDRHITLSYLHILKDMKSLSF